MLRFGRTRALWEENQLLATVRKSGCTVCESSRLAELWTMDNRMVMFTEGPKKERRQRCPLLDDGTLALVG